MKFGLLDVFWQILECHWKAHKEEEGGLYSQDGIQHGSLKKNEALRLVYTGDFFSCGFLEIYQF